MGRHQQAESSGIISFVICAIIAWFVMNAYMQFAPAIGVSRNDCSPSARESWQDAALYHSVWVMHENHDR